MKLKCPNAINACNFSVSGLFDPTSNVLSKVYFNPPVLGESLKEIASFQFSIFHNNEYVPISSFRISNFDYSWPIPVMSLLPIKLNVKCWSPIAFNDVKTTSLPVIFVEFASSLEFSIKMDILNVNDYKDTSFSLFVANEDDNFKMVNLDQTFLNGKRQVLAFVPWHENLYAANFYSNPTEMMQSIKIDELRVNTQQIEKYLPEVRPEKRCLLNLELVPAFALTRIIKTGDILTMGYCELNQRDSFWTSFVHLILFKDAEIKMIDESCAEQMATGKIPTTILPLINREFDIDITAYFVLRIVRFVRYYEDFENGKKWFPYVKKAIDYLASLRDEKNVPFARDFWADWKDIKGINNRLYGPHFVLITKAAVKEFNWLCSKLGESSINIEINAEPLWNGEYYQDVMRDGTVDGRFHQDQMIAELWNVCGGKERYHKMLKKAEELENQFGLPETLPFYPENEFGYKIGEYHNGGIWPWLCFADASARIASGNRKSGEALLYTVAATDILSFGDLCSNEYHHGVTGCGGGNNIQGWNSCAILPFSLCSSNPRNNYSKLLSDMRQ